MNKKIIILTTLFMTIIAVMSLSAQKNNKEILEDYFSRPAIDTVYENVDDFVNIEVGQWVILRKYEGKKETPVLLKYSVVSQEDGRFWIEVKDLRKKKTIVVKFLIEGIEGNSLANINIIDGKYTQNGEAGLAGMWNMFAMYLYPLQARKNAEVKNANFTCVSGTYKGVSGHSGSFKREISVEGPGISIDMKSAEEGTMFYHTAVPFGILGWNATNDKAEVIEFGFTGAESEIKE